MRSIKYSQLILHLSNEPESKLQGGLQLPDHPLRILLDAVPRELVLDVVQQVAHGIHVSHHRNPSVNTQQYLIQLDGQVEEDTHKSAWKLFIVNVCTEQGREYLNTGLFKCFKISEFTCQHGVVGGKDQQGGRQRASAPQFQWGEPAGPSPGQAGRRSRIYWCLINPNVKLLID